MAVMSYERKEKRAVVVAVWCAMDVVHPPTGTHGCSILCGTLRFTCIQKPALPSNWVAVYR
jgi:hypothetical protein